MKQFKEAHLEITTGGLNASIRAKGDTKSLILAWVLLTTHVSKKLKVPLPKMLAICAALRGDVEDLRRGAEICAEAPRSARSTFPDYVKEMPYDAVLCSLPGCYPLH